MSSRLVQLLAHLDRDGASELVMSTDQPIAVRIDGAYQAIGSPLGRDDLLRLLGESQLAALVAETDGVSEVHDLELDGRWLRAQAICHGGRRMLRLETRPGARRAAPAATPAPAPVAAAAVARETPRRRPVASADPEPETREAPRRPAPAPPLYLDKTPPPAARAAPPLYLDRTPVPPASHLSLELDPEPEPEPAFPPEPASEPGVDVDLDDSAPIAMPAPAAAAAAAVARPAPIATLVDEPVHVTPALAAIVHAARQHGATDLHIATNRAVMVRIVGELAALEPTPRGAAEVEALLLPLLGPSRRRQLAERGYVDLAVELAGAGRLRGNVSRQQGGLKGAFRIALARPPTLAELGLPTELAKLTEHHQGLVVIAGPSGHGKTTTLAALVDCINASEPVHILTIEDPVEIEHPRKRAVVSQREVGRHTVSFAAALKASLREDPDVIAIGELRDRETVEIAMTAAETGHLVIATMSTPSAAKTIDRLIDMFGPDEQAQIRASLAGALRAIVAQRLLPAANGMQTGGGVVAAIELVIGVLPLATLIRDNKLFQLPNLMQRGRAFGMRRLDDSLLEHVRAGRLAEDVALRAAENRRELAAAIRPEPAVPTATGRLIRRKDAP